MFCDIYKRPTGTAARRICSRNTGKRHHAMSPDWFVLIFLLRAGSSILGPATMLLAARQPACHVPVALRQIEIATDASAHRALQFQASLRPLIIDLTHWLLCLLAPRIYQVESATETSAHNKIQFTSAHTYFCVSARVSSSIDDPPNTLEPVTELPREEPLKMFV